MNNKIIQSIKKVHKLFNDNSVLINATVLDKNNNDINITVKINQQQLIDIKNIITVGYKVLVHQCNFFI